MISILVTMFMSTGKFWLKWYWNKRKSFNVHHRL